MDFKDLIRQLGERAAKLKEQTQTEEATKTALIMPFIQTLGYDVFNPTEVVPEFDADIPGIRRGEKVDYAVFKDGQPTILIECKHWKQNLEFHDGQLQRYFHVTKARFAILTNGIVYKFFSDLKETNIMDRHPFFVCDVTNLTDQHIEGLKNFHKSYFNEEALSSAANEMIHMNRIKERLTNEFKNPSEEFVKFIAQIEYKEGKVTQKVQAMYSDLVKRSTQQVLNEIINERLASAMKQDTPEPAKPDNKTVQSGASKENEGEKDLVETTAEELEGFYIVKSICRQKVDAGRIAHRDTQGYFGILLDDNKNRTICRLHLNKKKKYIETYDVQGGDKKEIQTIDDIYKYANEILKAIEKYEKKPE